MPQPITIPRLGWSMEEGVFGQWLKSPGELVQAGDMVFVLEGEKAAHEIESFDSGYLCVPADAPPPGATVKVGDTIGFLLAEGESGPVSVRGSETERSASPGPSAAFVRPAPAATSAHSADRPAAGPAARRLARELGIDLQRVSPLDPTGRIHCEDVQRAVLAPRHVEPGQRATRPIATPRARRRARELGVDWTMVSGTGRDGRVRERDVIASRSAGRPSPVDHEPSPSVPGRHIPASRLRRAIAQRMLAGVHQAAPVTLMAKIDAVPLVAFREYLKVSANPNAAVPSYNDILLAHVARALREIPELNACWFREGVYEFDPVHIAVAVDTPGGLLAPVLRDVDRLTIPQIAVQSRRLIDLTRNGQVSQEQLAEGTFTVTNLGMFGVDAFTPILNLPQAGILGVGRILEEPVVRGGQIVVGRTVMLSLTFDHRVVDGAQAARWLQRLGERLRTPDSLDAPL